MNDLVYVMCNLKLSNKDAPRSVKFDLEDVHSNYDWIIEDVSETIGNLYLEDEIDNQEINTLDVQSHEHDVVQKIQH